MGNLHRDVRIACPLASAETHVRAYVEHAQLSAAHSADSASAQFDMRLSSAALVQLGISPDDRGVHVSMRPIRDNSFALSRYRVRWAPVRLGPHTLFFGELAMQRSSIEPGSFALSLDGRFESPHDGALLETEHGSPEKIAQATAAALLGQIESFVLVEEDAERTRGAVHSNGISHGYAS